MHAVMTEGFATVAGMLILNDPGQIIQLYTATLMIAQDQYVFQQTEYKEYLKGSVCVGMLHTSMHNVASLVTTKQKCKMCSNLEYMYVFQNVLFMIWQSSLVQCTFISNKNMLI